MTFTPSLGVGKVSLASLKLTSNLGYHVFLLSSHNGMVSQHFQFVSYILKISNQHVKEE